MRCVLVAVLLLSQAAWAAEWRTLPPGERCVVTSALPIADGGRVAPTYESVAEPAIRLIAARIWQPTTRCTETALPFWRYWGESEETAEAALVERVRSLGGEEKLAKQAAEKVLGNPMIARPGAPERSPGSAAVLIPGDAGDNAPLAEYLASHGYVVATIPYQGTFIPGYVAGLTDLESQAQDLQRVIAELDAREFADASRVALVCHAISSTACAMLAMRDARIAALVSWEGGLPSPFEQELLGRAPYFEVAALRAPMLVVHAPHPNIDVSLLDPYRFASQLRVELPQTSEHHLLAFGFLEDVEPGLLKKPVQRAGDALRAATEVLRRFLDAELLGDAAARQALAAPRNAAADLIGQWQYRAGSDARLTTADLQRRLRADGVAGLREYCREVDCAVFADAEAFRRLAAWLPYEGAALAGQRMDFAKLRAETFPWSARAHAYLAVLAHEKGDATLSERASDAALELLPEDPELDVQTRQRIREQLEQLRRN